VPTGAEPETAVWTKAVVAKLVLLSVLDAVGAVGRVKKLTAVLAAKVIPPATCG
jgi:hypothetical protein